MDRVPIIAPNAEVWMLRPMLRLAENLVLYGLILLGLTLGSAAAGARLGGEDVVSRILVKAIV